MVHLEQVCFNCFIISLLKIVDHLIFMRLNRGWIGMFNSIWLFRVDNPDFCYVYPFYFGKLFWFISQTVVANVKSLFWYVRSRMVRISDLYISNGLTNINDSNVVAYKLDILKLIYFFLDYITNLLLFKRTF